MFRNFTSLFFLSILTAKSSVFTYIFYTKRPYWTHFIEITTKSHFAFVFYSLIWLGAIVSCCNSVSFNIKCMGNVQSTLIANPQADLSSTWDQFKVLTIFSMHTLEKTESIATVSIKSMYLCHGFEQSHIYRPDLFEESI